MAEISVGVRELKSHLSEYLREVKAGRTIVITEHGKAVGRIVPEKPALEAKIQAMLDAGLAEWNGQRLPSVTPVARTRGPKTVAELLLEDRR